MRELSSDLLFLDVQMPEMDGFEVLEELEELGPDRVPAVVFVTAYDRYAVKAFEVHAVDYLLKPFSEGRFRETLARALEQLERRRRGDLPRQLRALLASPQPGPRYVDRIAVKTDGRVLLVNVKDLDWIEAVGNYVRLHVGATRHLVRETMASLESKLDPEEFLRIHRSTIVNVTRCKELKPLFHGECEVLLADGTRLTLSRRYRAKLRDVLGRGI